MNEIIIALISALAVAVPSVWATVSSNKKHTELMDYKIEQLTDRVEKHNSVVERMALAEREIKAIWKNVDKLAEREDKDE